MNVSTRLLCAVAKTSPADLVFWFQFELSSVKIVLENVAHHRPKFVGKKKRR